MAHDGRYNAPVEIQDETTDRLTRSVLSAELASGTVGTPDDAARRAIKDLGDYLMSKTGNGGGPPPRKFLAMSGSEWTKILLGIAVMALVAFGGWLLVVRDAVRDSVTKDQLESEFSEHSAVPHPVSAAKADVKAVQDKVNIIDREQALMKKDVKHVRDQVDDIAKDVRYLRRRRRSP